MKFEMELHPNFVSDIVVQQLQEMYDHTKEAYFCSDPVEARAAIAVVLDYFMAPSDYAQWRADNDINDVEDRNLAEEVVEGFDHLERKRSHEEFLQDLETWAKDDKREWVGLTDHEIACLWGHANWGNTEYVKAFGRELEAKLKEKNTVAL